MSDSVTHAELGRLVNEARIATDHDPLVQPIDLDVFLPEVLDSLALATLIALIEDNWDLEFYDEEIEPEIFESLAHLQQFVQNKIARAE